jgi:hypothetical protein
LVKRTFAATDKGLFVTSDGGTSWAKPTDASYAAVNGATTNITSVVINPTTPTTVYIGGGNATVAKSTDGGATWAAANTVITLPAANSTPLTKLAIAASSPSTLYASVGSTQAVALYKTTNAASSWTSVAAAPDYTGNAYSYGMCGTPPTPCTGEQGWYDNAIAIDPTNANHVLAVGETVVETTDGGTTWSNVNGQAFNGGGTNLIHPDQHALAFRPDGEVWTGDDGGVYLYNPAGPSVTNANGNLNITQFHFGFNVVDGTLLAGAQDNSSAETSSSSLSAWTGLSTGDGGPSAITPNDTSVQFIEANRNLFVTTDAFSSVPKQITPLAKGVLAKGVFTPPMIVVPNTSKPSQPTVFYGGPDLYKTTDPTDASPVWTKVTSVGSGDCGITPNAAYTCVTAIAADPSNSSVIYVGFSDGTVEVSTDAGSTFTALAAQPFAIDKWVTGISVDPSNAKAITASFSYNDTRNVVIGNPHVAQYSYTTTPGTGTWTTITGSLTTLGAGGVSHVVYDAGTLLAATDTGVYGATSVAGSSTSWSPVGTGLPTVQVQDLVAADNGGLYAITHGRGAWVIPPWSITPGPSAPAGSYLYAVSCVSVTSCKAVGFISGLVEGTLIESWNGTTWSVDNGSPNGNGFSSRLFGVSCVSATSCKAVGSYLLNNSGVPGKAQTLIESWNGTTWSVDPSPNKGTLDNALSGVSCVSATSCKAVGYFTGSSADQTLIESWNGTKWSVASSPNSGASNNFLNGVRCVSASSCKAVGDFRQNPSLGALQTLVESWNGTKWSLVPSPNIGTNNDHNHLQGVSCVSTRSCKAVGYVYNSSTGALQTLIESWNGAAWSIASSSSGFLNGVSCASVTSCKAVGFFGSGVSQTLSESWNGTTWSTVPSPNNGTKSNLLLGVSCVSTRICQAVGYYDNGANQPLTESYG